MVNGPTKQVEEFANAVITQPGVRHGKLNLIPVEVQQEHHHHAAAPTNTAIPTPRPEYSGRGDTRNRRGRIPVNRMRASSLQ